MYVHGLMHKNLVLCTLVEKSTNISLESTVSLLVVNRCIREAGELEYWSRTKAVQSLREWAGRREGGHVMLIRSNHKTVCAHTCIVVPG